MLPICVELAETRRLLTLEESNVAVSAGSLGGPPVVQLLAACQSPLPGLASQVAEPAKVVSRPIINPSAAAAKLTLFLIPFDQRPNPSRGVYSRKQTLNIRKIQSGRVR